MNGFDDVKNKCQSVLTAFCGTDECDSPLDELEIDILSTALAEALTKESK